MNVFKNPQIADSYDDYYETEAGKKINEIEAKLIAAALNKIPKGKMLELGCGTGHWTKVFIENGFELTTTDISEAMLKYARQKELKAEIRKADSENLPFNNESFDVITSVTMMEFVNHQDKVFEEMYRVLKPNGYLLLGCLNRNSQLAIQSANDPVFKNANFFTPEKLEQKLLKFGTPEIKSGVHFSPGFEVMDATSEKENHAPAFMLALVQKNKSL